jgi:ArsR family transcriptional regulator
LQATAKHGWSSTFDKTAAGEVCQNGTVATKAASNATSITKRQLNLISRAIADPTRFEVFQRIAAGKCVACSDLRQKITVTAPTLSHHIKELENAGLIESTRSGKFMNLTVCSDIWRAYLKKLGEI